MLGAARWSLVPALLALSLAWPSAAYAIVPQVHDHGNFFSPDTVSKANALLLKIQDKHKKDVVVETYDKIPPDVLKRIPYENTEKGVDSFFDQWAKEIARNGKVDGIVILICKNQNNDNKTRVQEEVGEHTREKAFKENDRVDLHNIFKNKWAKDHNVALMEALQFIDSRMADHHKTAAKGAAAVAAQPSSGSGGSSNTATDHGSNILGWVCIGVCVLIGIWLIFGLIRAFSGGGGGYAGGGGGGYGYGGGGGGGFMSGLIGGLFGAMAGNWIYNNMFGGHSSHSSFGESSAHAADASSGNRDDFGPSDQGGGFSGGGGDVDGGSGGDVDSGDAGGGGGGGDWGGGGGDWGGGGDAGGGGGDWGGGGGGDFGGGGGGDFGGGGGGGDW